MGHPSPVSEAAAPRVLVVDDDTALADVVSRYLEREGFDVEVANDGASGLERALATLPDLVVLDLMLPVLDGLEVCRRLRTAGDVPIIMLTARDDEIDRILGLELGADDYVTKPFAPRELAARVKAILRRTDGVPRDTDVLTVGTLDVDVRRREVRVAGEVVALATREFDLVRYLADNVGLALSRQQILDGVWGPGWYGDERTVDVHVGQLRKKLGDALPLATVWGVGYRLG